MSEIRDSSIDAVRGLSVVLMLGANLAPYAVTEPHPFVYRAVSTFCAPCFVFLAGVMLGRKVDLWSRVLRRSAWLLGLAALLDLGAWGVRPFSGFDVLYAIAFSLVGVRALLSLSPRHLAFFAAVWCLSTPLLVARFGYRVGEPELWRVLQSLLFDGWFPLFPWLGLLAFGSSYAKARAAGMSLGRGAALGLALGLSSGALWVLDDTEFVSRGGYAELFYPPTPGVLGVFVGVVPALLVLARHPAASSLLRVLEPFGRRSLLVYTIHVLLIGRVLGPLALPPSWALWGAEFLGLAVATRLSVGFVDRLQLSSRFEPLAMLLGSGVQPPPRSR